MKRYIGIVLVMAMTILITSCKWGCEAEKIAVYGISTAIVSQLQCTNVAAVQADVRKIVEKAGLCEKKGPIADLVCPVIGEIVVSQLANQVPATWQCDTSSAQKNLKDVIVTACKLLPI